MASVPTRWVLVLGFAHQWSGSVLAVCRGNATRSLLVRSRSRQFNTRLRSHLQGLPSCGCVAQSLYQRKALDPTTSGIVKSHRSEAAHDVFDP